MKYRWICALLLALCLAASGAAAQTLPDLTTFSPGLTRASGMLGRGERVEMTAELSAQNMLYARDLSVLNAMLDGMTLTYAGEGSFAEGTDAMTLSRGEDVFSASLSRSGGRAELSVNQKTFGLGAGQGGWAEFALAGDALSGMAILDRVPLPAVCEAVENLAAGDTLPGGLTVIQSFAIERTLSDDGTRLTKINLTGSVAGDDGEVWAVSGYLRQPAGRAPKDTFQLTFTRDEDNALTATYSSTRSQSVAKKDRQGRVIVDTALEVSGKLGGYGVTTRLKTRLQNDWTADGENLAEKLTMTVTLGHTDRTPGRRMQRLNDLSIKLRNEMDVDSCETANVPVSIQEEAALTATFDGNTFLDIGMEGSAKIGGAARPVQLTGAPMAEQQDIRAAFEEAVVLLVQRVYPLLGEDTQKKAEKGLE